MKKIILILFLIILINISFGDEIKTEPGKVEIKWEQKPVSIYPPKIFGKQYPDIVDVIKRVNELLLKIAPLFLVILIIIGGLMYLLTPFGVENFIKKGHNFIKWSILGFGILLLVNLIFSVISSILGGPKP